MNRDASPGFSLYAGASCAGVYSSDTQAPCGTSCSEESK